MILGFYVYNDRRFYFYSMARVSGLFTTAGRSGKIRLNGVTDSPNYSIIFVIYT